MDNYMGDLQNELNESLERLEIITNTLDKINLNLSEVKIEVGSKVLVKFSNGHSVDGRVLFEKGNGVFAVKRDGYVGTINLGVNKPELSEHTLQNLSVGTYGKLEKEQWLLNQRITDIKKKIDETNCLKVNISNYPFSNESFSLQDVTKIINSDDFNRWYEKTCKGFKVQPIETFPLLLICGIVKEFILQRNQVIN